MVNSRLIAALCFLGFFLGNCAGAHAGLFSNTEELTDYDGPDAGMLVLSLGAYKGANYYFYKLLFQTRDGKKSGSLTYNPKGRPDYSNTYLAGAVRTYPLQPGEYEIYNVELLSSNGIAQERFSFKKPISISFTIKPRQTIYLGEFRAMPIEGRNFFGLPADAGAKFQLSDESARDIPIAKTQDSRVTAPEIRIPDPTAIQSPFFERLPGS